MTKTREDAERNERDAKKILKPLKRLSDLCTRIEQIMSNAAEVMEEHGGEAFKRAPWMVGGRKYRGGHGHARAGTFGTFIDLHYAKGRPVELVAKIDGEVVEASGFHFPDPSTLPSRYGPGAPSAASGGPPPAGGQAPPAASAPASTGQGAASRAPSDDPEQAKAAPQPAKGEDAVRGQSPEEEEKAD